MSEPEPGRDGGGLGFGTTVTRPLNVWPFGTRAQRLMLLVDPQPAETTLVRTMLRAMQYEYFRSETSPPAAAVRSTVLAAHGLLRLHNRGVLSHVQASAAAVVAATSGSQVFVAMAGDAAAFSWSGGVLQSQHSSARVERPLGAELEPPITLWCAPFGPNDRLVLVCGGTWSRYTLETVRGILSHTPTEHAAARLADALGSRRDTVRVLVADGTPNAPRRDSATRAGQRRAERPRPWARAVIPALLALVALLVGAAPLSQLFEPRQVAQARQAGALLDEANQTTDMYAAHGLAAGAQDLAQQAVQADPVAYRPLLDRSSALLDEIDRVRWVSPRMVVQLGQASGNVVDLAVSNDTLYTLDVAEGSVRGFQLDVPDQSPTPDTLLLRAGSLVGGRPLEDPVAMEYVPGPSSGTLTVVDQARGVVQLENGLARMRSLPSSRAWQQLAGLGSDLQGNLYVLDNPIGRLRLLRYPAAATRLADPPQLLIDAVAAPPLDHVSAFVPLVDLFLLDTSGQVLRYDRGGNPLPFEVRTPDGWSGPIAAAAPDGMGGLFLADAGGGRIVETGDEGSFIRQLRSSSLEGLRVLQSGREGQVLYGVGRDGVIAIDVPSL